VFVRDLANSSLHCSELFPYDTDMRNDNSGAALDPEAVRIGALLRGLREANGWTLERLGGAIGKTHHYLSKIERGHRKAKVTLCRDIAHAYGMQPEPLIAEAFPHLRGVALTAACSPGHDAPQERPA
jgi:DNA-binding XRE family transcriptional regulator